MFDPETQGRTASDLVARIAATHTSLREAECDELLLAAAWADVHYLDGSEEDYRPLVQRSCAWGGEGCPPVAEHCAHELGALRGTGATAARMLIADALDLRHRLPRLWALVRTGTVRAWQARKVAQATHELPWTACADIDAVLSGFLPMLAWPRFARLLDAAILDVDPVRRREREEAARARRGVWVLDSEDGLKTVVARAAAGDATWFLVTVSRIADILRLEGDQDPVDALRAKAVGILAQPALALRLLLDHAGDVDRQPDHQAAHAIDADPVGRSTAGAQADHAGELEDPDEPDLEGAEAGAMRLDLTLRAGLTARDLQAARPRVVLHLHLSDTALRCGDGVVRPEQGAPLTLTQVHDWLADTGCAVTVRPVLDPLDTAPVDGYEIPARLRDAVLIRNPVDVFPYGQATSRTLDLDHSVPYVALEDGGPPGQTGIHNLGPLSRSPHRVVTFGGWQRAQPDPGTYLFRSPNRYV